MRARRVVLIGLAILLLLPLLALLGVAFVYRLDLGSALHAWLAPRARFTIEPSKLTTARYRSAVWLGNVQSLDANEISGLALSRRRSDLLYGINDSQGRPMLVAFGDDGRDRGGVLVRGATNVDWEDLVSFELDGEPLLLIADVGDNFAWRPAITLYVVPEPELSGERFAPGLEVEPKWVLRVRYHDGPRDCEAVAVDERARQVLLLSKRDVPTRLYAVPLSPRRDDPRGLDDLLVARLMTRVPGIPQPTARDELDDPVHWKYRSMVTAMSLAPDRSAALVFTYVDAFRFARAPSEGWAQAFARTPERLPLPLLTALEAGCYTHDPNAFLVTSERRPAPLFRFELW